MLSIEEVKLLIEKLKALKGTDFQKLIDDNLKDIAGICLFCGCLQHSSDSTVGQDSRLVPTDLDWRESHKDSILDELLDKQIELKDQSVW
jgi:hypothetical protein